MENASKALLIAGAILIVILLIGIGMLIYSRTTNVIDTGVNSADSQEIQIFNSPFKGYEGHQKGSSIRSMISNVISQNATYRNDTSKQITVVNSAMPADASTPAAVPTSNELSILSNGVDTTLTYNVQFHYRDNGLIDTIYYSQV